MTLTFTVFLRVAGRDIFTLERSFEYDQGDRSPRSGRLSRKGRELSPHALCFSPAFPPVKDSLVSPVSRDSWGMT